MWKQYKLNLEIYERFCLFEINDNKLVIHNSGILHRKFVFNY